MNPVESSQRLRVSVAAGICRVIVDNPPMNIFDEPLVGEISRLWDAAEASGDIAVVIFDSADPDFFIAHYNLLDLLAEPLAELPTRSGNFNRLLERIRLSRLVSIGILRGAARGGGSEFLLGLDMRFADRDRGVLGQPETALGILPAGGGTQRLPSLVGRARALEIMLGGLDIPADVAERYGYVNRALSADELDRHVDRLATAIASHPRDAVALTKAAVNKVTPWPVDIMADESLYLDLLRRVGSGDHRMRRALEEGAQTREGELAFESLMERIRD